MPVKLPYFSCHKGTYYYVAPQTRKWHRLGTDYDEAVRQYRQLRGLPATGPLQDLIERYVAEVTPTKGKRQQVDERRYAARLVAVFGMMQPDDVTPADVATYLDLRATQGVGVAGNREIALLSHVYTKAMRWGKARYNPCFRVERNAEEPRSRLPTVREIRRFLTVAPPWLGAYIDLKLATGMRQQDLLALTLPASFTPEGILTQPLKTKRRTGMRTLYLWSPELRAVVRAILTAPHRPKGPGPIFVNLSGRPYTASGFQSNWYKWMTKALTSNLVTERFHEHDLRATAASEANAQGLDSQALIGHTNEATHRRYLRRRTPTRTVTVRWK